MEATTNLYATSDTGTVALRRIPPSPRCPITQERMRLSHIVPVDCKKARPQAFGHVYWCDRSQYGRVHPLPTQEQVAEFYALEHYYTHGRSHFADVREHNFLDKVRGALAWRLDFGTRITVPFIEQACGRQQLRICDIGCGSGRLAAELARRGHRVVGIEVDPEAVLLEHRGPFELLTGTAEALPHGVLGRRFDCVIMSHVLEHCIDPLRALSNARGLLGPGGKMVCEVPNNAALARSRSGAAWEMFDVPRHLHFFTEPSLVAFCGLTAFEIESVHYAHYSRQFGNDWIETERQLWRALTGTDYSPLPLPVQNSKWEAWKLLAMTALAPRRRKYDSVGLVARTC